MVYHADRAVTWTAEDKANSPQRLAWLEGHKTFLWISSAISAGLAAWSLIYLDVEVIRVGVVLAAVGLLYNVPIPLFNGRLKDTQGFRILLIVGCWVVGGVYLPLHQHISAPSLPMLMGWKASIMIPNVLMAEWVDRKGDVAHQIRGTGSWLGKRQITYVSLICLSLSLFLLWEWAPHASNQTFVLLEAIGLVGLVSSLVFRKKWQSENIVMLDAWIGFPIIIWLIWMLSSAV